MAVIVDSLRKRTFEAWVKNPYATAKKLCSDLQLDYRQHGNYLNRLLSEFRSYHSFGLPQEAHFPEHRVFEWDNIPRALLPGEGELDRRLKFWHWYEVANRNGMWVFNDDRGSVHWYKEGLVRLYLKGELQLAKAKELFCRAFRWFTPQELRKYLDVPLKEKYKKWTFELGSPVPRFDIRTFERSHGLRIFSDGSHPTSVHVGESTFDLKVLLDEQRQATADLGSVVQQFGVEIQEHMKLIKLWQKEAKHARSIPVRRIIKEEKPQKSLFEWMI